MKSRYFLGFIVVVILGSLWYGRGHRLGKASSPPPSDIELAAINPAAPGSTPAAVGLVKPEEAVAISSAGRTVREVAPPLTEIRKAMAANPHVTPPALIAFSVSLGEKMEVGLKSEDAARSLFDELEECVLGGDLKGNHSVQGLCLLNAKRLRTKYPSLADRFAGLEKQADPVALKLMQAAPE